MSWNPDVAWRVLKPSQDLAIAKAFDSGVAAGALAVEYRVTKRTIYRAIIRGRAEAYVTVDVGPYRAEFVLTADGPLRVGAWVAI